MSGTYQVRMGDRGRLVMPAELRASARIGEGDPLVLIATEHGIVLLDRDQLKARVRADLAGTELVDSLLSERRQAAAAEDAPTLTR